jgi:hypothetical protein
MQYKGVPMAPFIPVPNAARVSLLFTQADGEVAENVFGVQLADAWTAGELAAMAQAFLTWWEVGDGAGHSYAALMGTGITSLGAEARDLTTSTSPVAFVANGAGDITGDDATEPLMNGASFTMTARTGLAGRSQRGRTYMIGLCDDFVDGTDVNKATASAANSARLAFNALITKVTATDAGATLVVISTRHNNLPRLTGITTPITSYGFHDLFLDYQRRRAPGHNRHH